MTPHNSVLEPERRPRICMPTARAFNRRAYQCSLYEAQDVLCGMDEVDLICLEPGHGFRLRERWQRRLTYKDLSNRLVYQNPGLRPVRLNHDYELFVAVCQNHWDLLYLNAVTGWKDRCRTSVCWLDELWAADIPICRHWLHALRQFDHVFVGYSGTVAPLSEAIERPCHWLPAAVDAVRFSPYPDSPRRVLDVYSVGRRWDGMHDAFLERSARTGSFYVHDTFPAMANMTPYDAAQHRRLYANHAKRSRYFVVAPAKMNLGNETQGQVEMGYRYFEGAAAGTVMIGQPPDFSAFSQAFPWPDVVIPVKPDGSDVAAVLDVLDSDPSRAATIGHRNAVESLRRHDWMHRWMEIYRVSGTGLPHGQRLRALRLEQLAEPAISKAPDITEHAGHPAQEEA